VALDSDGRRRARHLVLLGAAAAILVLLAAVTVLSYYPMPYYTVLLPNGRGSQRALEVAAFRGSLWLYIHDYSGRWVSI
jgi:hypothetical protein